MRIYELKLKHGCCWITIYSGDIGCILVMLRYLQDSYKQAYAVYRNDKMIGCGTAEHLLETL